MSETEIIKGCIANDRKAQRTLYDTYKDSMYTLAYRITNDWDQSNDVLQEGFLEVFRGLKGFKRNSTLATWIHTIILRKALKMINKKIHFEEIDSVGDMETIDWGPRMDVEHLERAIQNLPTGYRTVFTLVEIEGYKHREVAEELGISVNASKTQLFKAKKKLREKLEYFKS